MAWRPLDCEVVPPLPPGFFEVTNAEYEIWENAAGTPSNNIIRVGTTWGVQVRWRNWGILVPIINPACSWRITAFLEQFGPLEGPALPPITVPFNNVVPTPPGFVSYDNSLTFPPPVVPEGTFRFAIRLRMVGPPPVLQPVPLGCMADGPMLDFYP